MVARPALSTYSRMFSRTSTGISLLGMLLAAEVVTCDSDINNTSGKLASYRDMDIRGLPLLSGAPPDESVSETHCRKCAKAFGVFSSRSKRCTHCHAERAPSFTFNPF